MPHVNANEILIDARNRKYGVLSLLGGNLEMVVGLVKGAEEQHAPLILVYNEDVTPKVPMELAVPMLVNAAQRATVPVATILDHGRNLEHVVQAIRFGVSSVMFDGSHLPYEENVAQTAEIARVAHAVGVDVEAELGSIAGSAITLGDSGPGGSLTDPDVAADFVERTKADVLAISFGNVHGVYEGEPQLDLDRVRKIHARISVPLAMHGASGLAYDEYRKVIQAGISKVCYYTSMGIGASNYIRRMLVEAGEDADRGRSGAVYHEIISRAVDYFHAETKRLISMVGCSGVAA
jgi:fructose-bisphosphate aldolase class II